MKWRKPLAILCLVSGLISIWFVGIVHHQIPFGIALLPMAYYWWTDESDEVREETNKITNNIRMMQKLKGGNK